MESSVLDSKSLPDRGLSTHRTRSQVATICDKSGTSLLEPVPGEIARENHSRTAFAMRPCQYFRVQRLRTYLAAPGVRPSAHERRECGKTSKMLPTEKTFGTGHNRTTSSGWRNCTQKGRQSPVC